MGAWGYNVLENDTHLDFLSDIGDKIGYDLYPLDFTDEEARSVAESINSNKDSLVAWCKRINDEDAVLVLAAVIVSTGAELPTVIHEAAVRIANLMALPEDTSHWSDPEARAASMKGFANMVDTYDGTRIDIGNRGLFEVMGIR